MSLEPRQVHRSAPSLQTGITLIELMIVVVVIALLAFVVLPSYQGYVTKARRTDAKMALTSTAQAMERHATENAAAGYSTYSLGTANKSENGYYLLSLSNLSAANFTLSAAPLGAQASDTACGTFTLNQRGGRGVVGATKPWQECW